MIDIETLDTRPTAAILSVAAVKFDLEEPGRILDELHVHVDIDSNLALNRTVSAATLLWWLDQGDEARRKLLEAPTVPLVEALVRLEGIVTPDDRVWGNGASFDQVILTDAYRSCGRTAPWKFYKEMCYRTLKTLYGYVPKPAREGVPHDALSDAKLQALHLQHIYQRTKAA
jgi:hypothetical protein